MADKGDIEKRKHPRKPTPVKVELVSGGRVNKACARDVSLSGMFVKNEDTQSYEVDEDIVLAFESRAGQAHTIEARIVRKDKHGLGIRFKEELVAAALKHAADWINHKS
jgi:hypothetical protein